MKSADHNENNLGQKALPSGDVVDSKAAANESKIAKENTSENIVSGPPEDLVDLHICYACGSHMVYPTDWADVSNTHWEVHLRCPECEWRHVGTYTQSIVDRFDVILDDGTEELVSDLKILMRANMEDQVERFVTALNADAVWPMDF
jgi:hypothetical protein